MKKSYYLFNPGRLSRKDNTLKITPTEEEGTQTKPTYLPVENVEQFYVFGSLDVNSALLNFLGQKQIILHFFDYYENYTGSFLPRDGLLSGKMLLCQTSAYSDKKHRLKIAKQFVEGASYNMLKNLQYYQRRERELGSQIERMEQLRKQIEDQPNVEALMGVEGNIRKVYYEAFDTIINDFEMNGRSMRPPKNEVNALISFANMMCYAEVLRSIHQTQLNPTVSFLHTPGERRYSLALDIAEVFKPILVDRIIFKVLNKRMLTDRDFDKRVGSVLIKEAGRKTFLREWDTRLMETIKHRKLNRSVRYKQLIKLECYKLSKDLLGIEEYQPLKMWW